MPDDRATTGDVLHTAVLAPKMSDLVARQLRGQIVRGELPLDAALPSESELMKSFNVGRPTLREAYRVLESEGLLYIRRGAQGGARVRVPNPEVASRYAGMVLQYQGATLRDLADARQMMEPQAAGILAKRQDSAAVGELLKTVAADRTRDHEHELLWYEPFHIKVIELTGNLTLTLFAHMTGQILQAAKTKYLTSVNESDAPQRRRALGLATKAHERLIAYIEAGDFGGAETFWSRHLSEASEMILSTMPGAKIIDLLN